MLIFHACFCREIVVAIGTFLTLLLSSQWVVSVKPCYLCGSLHVLVMRHENLKKCLCSLYCCDCFFAAISILRPISTGFTYVWQFDGENLMGALLTATYFSKARYSLFVLQCRKLQSVNQAVMGALRGRLNQQKWTCDFLAFKSSLLYTRQR